MKRPLALVGFCYLLTLAAAVLVGERGSLLLACVCLSGLVASLLLPKLRSSGVFPLALLAAALAFGSFAAYSGSVVQPARALADRDAVVEGTVCELPYQAYGRFYYIVAVDGDALPGALKQMKVRVSCQNALHVEPYSRIRAKLHLFLPSGGEGYSSRNYYASRGIQLFAYLYEYEPVTILPPADRPPYYYALKLRSGLLRSVREMLPPEEAALVNGVVFGDQTSLSEQVSSDFRTIGVSHILSVSGLHMTTMAELILMLLLLLRLPKKPAALAAAGGVFGFMAVTCFVPSVTRSGIMCLLYLFGLLLSRQADPLNSLGAAVLLIGLLNPYAAADVGLLLSFFATLGLILFSGRISRFLDAKFDRIKRISPLVRGAHATLATTFAAMFFTLPIGIVFFGSVSLIAPLANLLELVPSTLMMNFAAIAAVLNLAAPQSFLAMPFALVAGLLAKYMEASAHWLAQLPYASVPASHGFVLLWLSATLLLAAAALLLAKTKRLYRAAALLSVILLLTGILSYQISMRGVTRLAVLDVGSAEAVVLTRGGHAAVLGCGGLSSSAVSRYLKSEGIAKLDYLQPLTKERREAVNCSELADTFHPDRLVMGKPEVMDGFLQASLPSVKDITFYTGTASATLWGDVRLDTVSAGKAVAVRAVVDGVSVLLLPDGANAVGLPSDWLESDFLVLNSAPKEGVSFAPVYTVLSMDAEGLRGLGRKAARLNPIPTAGEGPVVLAFQNGNLQIRRE